MKKLYTDNEIYQAEKIVKTNDSIIGYNGNQKVFAFKGINDFSKFQLDEGQEWDLSEEDEQALYQLDLVFRISLLEMGVKIYDL